MLQTFFQCPRLHFDGMTWTVRLGFRTVAGPYRYGADAKRALQMHHSLPRRFTGLPWMPLATA